MTDTIFALSSGAGQAGVAVIRISGPLCAAVWTMLTGRGDFPAARYATLRKLRNPATGDIIDHALCLWFSSDASYTGEAVLELHVHGGRAVVAAVFGVLEAIPGCRLALAGEFTRRAFENGKADLAQVEAIADLVNANTEVQRRQALRGLDGALGRMVSAWRDSFLHIRALIAAEIDFSDEGDVGQNASAGIDSLLERLESDMRIVLAASGSGRVVAEGLRVAIVGRPNMGKSSLLNALAGYDAAIVTEFAGTTRDLVQVTLDIAGFAVVLTDTAGLRDAADPVEQIGVARAREASQNADVVLALDDHADWSGLGLDQDDPRLIRIRSKSDLRPAEPSESDHLSLSVNTMEGISDLRRLLHDRALRVGGQSALVTTRRQVTALTEAVRAVSRARAHRTQDIELRDHEVHLAQNALDSLIGKLGTEEVLGAVFSRFCVGK